MANLYFPLYKQYLKGAARCISPYFERLKQRWFLVTPKSSHTLEGNPDYFLFNARCCFPQTCLPRCIGGPTKPWRSRISQIFADPFCVNLRDLRETINSRDQTLSEPRNPLAA